MSQSETSKKLSIPVLTITIITFIVFVVLKLIGVVGWSWLVVCTPLFVYLGYVAFMLFVSLALLAGAGIFMGIAYMLKKHLNK